MKVFGWFLVVAGVIWLVIALNLDTSVETGGGLYLPDRVENIGLIARRQNHLFIGGLVTLVGVLLAIFGDRGNATQQSSVATTPALNEEEVDHPPAERDLASDTYRLWLARHYGIERNEVFERFTCQDKTFATLGEALEFAHSRELGTLEQQRLAEERAREEAIRVEEQYQARVAELAEAQARTDALVTRALIAFVAILIVASPFLYMWSQKVAERERARQAALAQEAKEILTSWGFRAFPEVGRYRVNDISPENPEYWCDAPSGKILGFSVKGDEAEILASFDEDADQHESDDYAIADRVYDAPNEEGKIYLDLLELTDTVEVELCGPEISKPGM